MSQIISIGFDNAKQGDRMPGTLQDLQRDGLLHLEDTATVVRDADGKVSYRTTRGYRGRGRVP